MIKHVLQTGLKKCYDSFRQKIDCPHTGQDGEYRTGIVLPANRFEVTGEGDIVRDHLTGLVWTRNASPGEFPLNWQESLDFVREMNNRQAFGFSDWRLPDRVELRSLVDLGTTRPVLPPDNPFENIVQSWYWSATTAVISPTHAWYVEMSGGRMFYGHKEQFFMLWPVRGKGNATLRCSGQHLCYETDGKTISCTGSGQDGENRLHVNRACPVSPRFEPDGTNIKDRLTGLVWHQQANLTGKPVEWQEALDAVQHLNQTDGQHHWRLPNINELESLVDCQHHSPALPEDHLFEDLHDTYWSSTTSLYEPDWSFALYFNKGAVGVGHKRAASFYVWPVHTQGC